MLTPSMIAESNEHTQIYQSIPIKQADLMTGIGGVPNDQPSNAAV